MLAAIPGKERLICSTRKYKDRIKPLTEERSRLDAQLANDNFVSRAPEEKVAGLRDRSAELADQIATLTNNLAALSD